MRTARQRRQLGLHAAFFPGNTTRPTTARLTRPKISRTANWGVCADTVRQTASTTQARAAPPLHPVTHEPEPPQRAARGPGRLPAHGLAPGAVPDGEHMRPAPGDAQRPDRRPVPGPVPQRVQHESGEHGREQDDEVPQPDVAGQNRTSMTIGMHRPEERQQPGVGVVEEAGQVGEPGRDTTSAPSTAAREHHPGVAGAPAVLLAHERVQVVRADPGRQHDRQVDHPPAGPAHVEPGVHVLGVRDERRAALRFQRGPPVHRGGAHADGRAEPVPGHLDRAVEHLLDRAGRPLDPGLPAVLPRKYCGVCTIAIGRVVHVGQRLGQEVAARREVGVQDDDELAVGAGERVPQVAALLVLAGIGPHPVAEAELGGQPGRLRVVAVVQHVGRATPR